MTQKVLKIVDVMVASETWPRLARFALLVCVPLLVTGTISLVFFDASLATYFKSRYGNHVHLFSRHTTDFGKAEPYFALSVGLLILFFILRRLAQQPHVIEKWRTAEQWSLYALLSLLMSGALVQVLKHVFGRQRPYADAALSSHVFQPFIANYEFHSMPSGHSQVLFTVATFFAALLPRGRWLWWGVAMTFALTRVVTLNHWMSDILVGAAVGIFGTVLTFRLMNYRKRSLIGARVAGAILVGAIMLPSSAHAEAPGPFGLGLIVGDPTGLTSNYRLSSQRSVDTTLAWSFGRDPGFEIHADYLWHRDSIFKPGRFAFDLHYGVGGRFMSFSDRHGTDRTGLGPRLPVGIGTNFNQPALEVFAEVALIMNIIPSTTADLDFGVGARVYF